MAFKSAARELLILYKFFLPILEGTLPSVSLERLSASQDLLQVKHQKGKNRDLVEIGLGHARTRYGPFR